MKQFILLVSTLATMLLASDAWAQSGVSVSLGFTPPNSADQISPWISAWVSGQQDLKVVIFNTGPGPREVILKLSVLFDGDSVVNVWRESAITVPVGRRVINRTTEGVNFGNVLQGEFPPDYDGKYFTNSLDLPQAIASGMLPIGSWRFCAAICDSATGDPLDEMCIDGIVSQIQPPRLLFPIDTPLFAGQAILMRWINAAPLFGQVPVNDIEIWEVLEGQSPVQAILNNLPIASQRVTGTTQWLWTPQGQQIMPGERREYVWMATPVAPGGTIVQDNDGASAPETFWMKEPTRHVDTVPKPPCGTVDIGPDVIRDGQDAPAVRLGCDPKPGHAYQWSSDPQGVWSTQSRIRERPLVTTRYVLVQTDPTGNCVVSDEAWVLVRRAFEVRLKIDPCGNLSPEIDLTTTIGNTNGGGSSSNNTNTSRRDAAVIVNGIPYDASGQVIGNDVPPINPCSQPAPPSDNPVPTLPYTYIWNTGATTQSILPSTPGTYTCTVTEGERSAVGSFEYKPSQRFRGEFTKLVYTEQMRLNDPQMPFVIKQNGNEDDQLPVYNAYGYQVKIDGPNGFHLVLEDRTSEGFQGGEIRWAGEPDPNGVSARPGKYTCQVSFINCDHPDHSETRKYMFGAIRDAIVPLSQARRYKRMNTFEIKVKRAKR